MAQLLLPASLFTLTMELTCLPVKKPKQAHMERPHGQATWGHLKWGLPATRGKECQLTICSIRMMGVKTLPHGSSHQVTPTFTCSPLSPRAETSQPPCVLSRRLPAESASHSAGGLFVCFSLCGFSKDYSSTLNICSWRQFSDNLDTGCGFYSACISGLVW